MKLGLRAQSQCRATLETLAAIKNPVAGAYVGQANFANNQQINNTQETPRPLKKQKSPNEQLEQKKHEQWLDGGTSQEAVRSDQELETVDQVHRATND